MNYTYWGKECPKDGMIPGSGAGVFNYKDEYYLVGSSLFFHPEFENKDHFDILRNIIDGKIDGLSCPEKMIKNNDGTLELKRNK